LSKLNRVTLAGMLLFAASCAQADVVTWTLHNVTFDDGGTASGFFTVDTTLDHLPHFDIVTTAGTTLKTPFEYTPSSTVRAATGCSPCVGGDNNAIEIASGNGRTLTWAFDGSIDKAGVRTIIANVNAPGETADFRDPSIVRTVIGGHIAAVPEPSAVAFLGFAVALLILFPKRLGLGRAKRCCSRARNPV